MKPVSPAAARRLYPLASLALLWVLITAADPDSWLVGLPAIAVALLAYDRLQTGRRGAVRLTRVAGFGAWFLGQSLRAGIDVARRALAPRLRLNPAFVRYPLDLPDGPARLFLVNCLSLLPGTLSAALHGDELQLHVLHAEADVIAETRAAERRVQRLFGIGQAADGD